MLILSVKVVPVIKFQHSLLYIKEIISIKLIFSYLFFL